VDHPLLESPALARWLAPRYLDPDRIAALVQTASAKPNMRYLVLDDFFRGDALDELIAHCKTLGFSEELDRRDGTAWLLYDGAVKFANATDRGWDLFADPSWHAYCALLVGSSFPRPPRHVVKLRYHKPDATGFWIHSDAREGERSLVAIAYFNREWRVEDGGLLQLWREDEASALNVPEVDWPDPTRALDVLASKRIRTRTPGGGFRDEPDRARDLVLVDQVVPEYNRLFLCNLQTNPAWHSVTPSRGRARYGFVQWIG
jgi:hypothetical protein